MLKYKIQITLLVLNLQKKNQFGFIVLYVKKTF